MKSRINIGVVGCGYWGPNLIRNFRALPACRLKVMCDVNEGRLAHLHALYPEIERETDFARLVADPDLHAIVIATAVPLHFPMAQRALLAGKHVMVEKPMAASVAECEELIAISRRLGLVLMVGHTFLFSEPIRKIREIVDHRDIGDLRYIASRRLNLGLFQRDINVAWDLAPHDISIILHIMQEMPHRVNCCGGSHITRGVEDVTWMSLHFSRERSAIIHTSWHDPRKVREMTIVGSSRMIVYDDVAGPEKLRIHDVRIERPPLYDTFAAFHYAYHYGDTYCPYIKHEEPLRNQCLHFLECIREDQTPLTSGAQGLDVVRILEASTESLRNHGAAVQLPAVNPAPTRNGYAPSIVPHRNGEAETSPARLPAQPPPAALPRLSHEPES